SRAERISATTGSGTLAVEMLAWSLLSREERVIAATYGEFGDRLIESLERRGCVVTRILKKEDEKLSPEDIEKAAAQSGATSLFMVHNETGNGIEITNIRGIATFAKKIGLKVLVDSVSGFAALPTELDSWGIDAIATCAHKGIASVTGIGIDLLGNNYAGTISKEDTPAYLDLGKSLQFAEKNETPFTPSTGAFSALSQALHDLDEEGLAARISRTAEYSDHVRARMQQEGYTISGTSETRSSSVLNVVTHIKSTETISRLRSAGFIVGGGLGTYREKSIRIGVMGAITIEDLDSFVDEFLKADR
ncbi:soluble hydrogenase, small subunit, partial [mine drainage metagenome]